MENERMPEYQDLQLSDEQLEKKYKDTVPKKYTEEEYILKFLILVNMPAPAIFLYKHPTLQIKDKFGKWIDYRYLPIDKVRFTLTRIFGVHWREEALRESIMFNSIVSTVRLHYKIPGTNIWTYKDGKGAMPVQTDKGESAANMAAIKSDAIQKAFPGSDSYALSNAAAKIGDVFGGNINTQDPIQFMGTWNPDSDEKETPQTKTQNKIEYEQSTNGTVQGTGNGEQIKAETKETVSTNKTGYVFDLDF